jgi:hypothetical protein
VPVAFYFMFGLQDIFQIVDLTHTVSYKWLTTDDNCCYESHHYLHTNALINVTPERNVNIRSSVVVERNQVQRGEIPACFVVINEV